MPGRVELKLAELGISLPTAMPPLANYVPYVVTGNLVAVSGQVPAIDGKSRSPGRSVGASRPSRRKTRHGCVSSTCWCI